MKKQAITIALAAVLGLGVVGCGQQPAASNEPAKQETTSQTTEKTETKDTATTEQTQKDTTAAEPAQNQQAAPAAADSTAQISEEEAKSIAFADAGVTEADVTLLSVHLETDDGVTRYEVDFNVGTTDYDYDIDPATGAIIERSMDLDD